LQGNLQSGDRIHSCHARRGRHPDGTAYLATQEIVETGALTALYQRMILKSPPGEQSFQARTLDFGYGPEDPRVEAILSLEREYAAGHQDELSFRTRMEEMAAEASSLRPEPWTGWAEWLWMTGLSGTRAIHEWGLRRRHP